MKTTFLATALIIFWAWVGYKLGRHDASKNLKTYQIQLEPSHLKLYDNGRLVGRCKFEGTSLDALIFKDNE